MDCAISTAAPCITELIYLVQVSTPPHSRMPAVFISSVAMQLLCPPKVLIDGVFAYRVMHS